MSFNADLMTEIKNLSNNIPNIKVDDKLKLDKLITPRDFAEINGQADVSAGKKENDLKKAAEKANALTDDLIKVDKIKKYTNLTEVNNDIVQRFDNDAIKELFPNEEMASKDNSDIITMLHRLAQEEKNPNAQNILAVCYISGIGLEKNEEVALRLFEQSAEQNYPSAQRNLAIMLENQGSTDKNRIIELYEKSAAQNDGYALNNLAACYMTGDGVKKNVKEAVTLFDKAVKVGDDYAMVNLADCYSVGNGVKRDDKKAYELYAKAAENKNQDGLINAAECLLVGKGVKQDLNKALEYFKIAADMGNTAAQKRFEEIQEKITPKKHEEVSPDGKETQKKSALDKSFGLYRSADASKNKTNEELAKDTDTISKGAR